MGLRGILWSDSLIERLCLLAAALMGASGVIFAAAAAHGSAGSGLDAASHMLLAHAVAIMAGSGLSERGLLARSLGRLALLGWTLGACLFAADIAMRALAGSRLFAMAAPVGGTLLIVSWLVMATAVGVGLRQRGQSAPRSGEPS